MLGSILYANLAEMANRLNALLGEMASHGLVDLLFLDGAEAELNCFVTIGSSGLNLAYLVGVCLDNRNRRNLAVFVEELGHADLGTVDSVNHSVSHSPTA